MSQQESAMPPFNAAARENERLQWELDQVYRLLDAAYLPHPAPQPHIATAKSMPGINKLAIGLRALVRGRAPDFVIGDPANPYLKRWWLLREPTGCIYLHHILRDDDDRALHDHPWPSTSIILSGGLREVLQDRRKPGARVSRDLLPGSITSRSAEAAHRLEVLAPDTWSLFITGPKEREWGFHCPKGWVHWKDFVAKDSEGEVGRGCGEMA